MDPAVARAIALREHAGQRDRVGDLLVDHVARVAAAVPPAARSIAWLHDVLERTPVGCAELEAAGLSPLERGALDVLTRRPGEAFEVHALRVVHAPGAAGELARAVKSADLLDHIAVEHAGRVADDAPPYRWALRHLAAVERPVAPQADVLFLPPLPAAGSPAHHHIGAGSVAGP